jgi:hypothetical protein
MKMEHDYLPDTDGKCLVWSENLSGGSYANVEIAGLDPWMAIDRYMNPQ